MGDKGASSQTKATEQKLTQSQIDLAQKQEGRSEQLYALGLPGLEKANEHYTKIASGDPNAIFREVAPAAESIKANATATKRAIDESSPRGGARDLAKDEADISAAGQVGNLETKAYTSSFPALASLASGSLGLSVNEIANAIAGFQGASATVGQQGNQEAEGKAAQLGFFGAMAGAGATAASAACWIAEKLYGKFDRRTFILRHWLNRYYDKTAVGAVVMFAYRRVGRSIAAAIEACPSLGLLFRWAFENGLKRAALELADEDWVILEYDMETAVAESRRNEIELRIFQEVI